MGRNRFFNPSICLFYLIAVFLTTGCGGVKVYSDFEPPDDGLGRFRAIEIPDFETEIDVPDKALTKIPDKVADMLDSKTGGFEEVNRGAIGSVPPENTIVLLGLVTNYQSATDVEAEGGAVRFGESAFSVELTLVEESTGRVISGGSVSGFSSFGFLKSGLLSEGFYETIAKEIVNFISENY